MSSRTAARWAGYVAVAIVFAIACGFLSHWQFSRNADRATELRLVQKNYNAAPVALSAVIPVGGVLASEDRWRQVTLHGTYLSDQELLARNRAQGGTSAYEILTPFRTDEGRVLLVDRGWIPPRDRGSGHSAVPAAPPGQVTAIVRLTPGEPLPGSGRGAPEGQVPSIHLPLVAEKIAAGPDLIQSAYGILVSQTPAPAVQAHALQAPDDDPGPYLSYAVQWILFAIMGFVFIWYIIRTELRHRREDAEDDDAGQPRVRRPRRPLDRDMQDEDALLDAR